MKALLCVTLLAACAAEQPRQERPLAELANLSASIDVDVGVPQDPLGLPKYATGMTVDLDYPGDTCLSLQTTAVALVDDSAPDAFDTGGPADDGCAKPSIYLDAPRSPKDISTITIADGTATYSIQVARLFVNPTITLPSLAVGPVVARIDDPRAISAATVWWRSADGAQGWMKPVDASTQGELRFMIPAGTSGSGTLGITITIRDNDVTCIGFSSCRAIVRGGAAFAVTL